MLDAGGGHPVGAGGRAAGSPASGALKEAVTGKERTGSLNSKVSVTRPTARSGISSVATPNSKRTGTKVLNQIVVSGSREKQL